MSHTGPSLGSYGLFIDGQWRDAASGATFTVENPATGGVIATVAEGDAPDIDRAVEAGERALAGPWGHMDAADRARVIWRIGELLSERVSRFAEMDTLQSGRPIREMKAQIGIIPEWFFYFASLARTLEGSVPPFRGPYLNYVRRIPLGVVGQLTPWNHPLLILTKKVAPALAGGNTIVVKPSEMAPVTALELAALASEAGLPPGVLNVVPGFGQTAGAALVAHPSIAKLDVTGGTETGRVIAQAAGARLIRATCELGGKAPLIICADADLDQAVNGAAFASFVAAGQVCVQGARLLVQQSIYKQFTERFIAKAKSIRVGTPTDPSTQMGPLVSASQMEHVLSLIRAGESEGARLACGGQRMTEPPFDRGHFVEPTVFVDVKPDMTIMQEEIFGPVTAIIPFDTEDDAIEIANDVRFGLGASLWTQDIMRAHSIAPRIRAGIVWINDHHRVDSSSVWGGFKDSGIGRENGLEALYEYTEPQSIVIRTSNEPFDWFSDDSGEERLS